MVIIIFIIVIIVIIIFIHYLSKNIDNFSNYDITQLNTLDSDLNIYSENINFLSNNNTINSDLLCINGECIDFAEDRNKTLPKPSGEDGVCNDDQCYECTCENGKAAERTCTKKKSQSDREQCVTCNAGYGLVNGKCVECTGNTYNDRHNRDECQSCSNLKCLTGGYPQGNPYYKRNNCGGSSKGTCSRKTCKCEANGIATWSCSTETENTCAQCYVGHKLTANAGTVGAKCVACEANTYQNTINETTSCMPCAYCTDFNGKKRYRINCGGTSPGQCVNCPSCPAGEYRINCGGNSEGTCTPCPSCTTGQHLTGCEGTSPGECRQNSCSCSGGREATGSECTSHEGNICISCDGSHYKVGESCTPCKSTACPSDHFRTGWTCAGGASCKRKRWCAIGQYRSEGSDTSDAVCKAWSAGNDWRSFYYQNGHSREGDYKYAWIESRGKNGNLYTYAVWDNEVVYYKNHGNMSLRATGESPWMPWGHNKQRRFHGGTLEYDDDDFNCEEHGRKWSGNNYYSFYPAGNPTIRDNGVCDSGSGKKWSQNDTYFRKIKWQDRTYG